MKSNIAILIPCYNEEKTISNMVDNLDTTKYQYIIVNDGSTDKTLDILIEKNQHILTYSINQGKGYAIKCGLNYIFRNMVSEYVLIMDGDGQHSIKDIKQFETALKIHPDVKIIVGNRLHNPKGMSLVRLGTNVLMSGLISRIIGQKIRDTQCGMKLIHKDVFEYLPLKSDRFGFDSEILIKSGLKGYKIVSIPITCIYKKGRKSKIKPIKDTYKFLKLLYNIKKDIKNE